MRLNALLTLLLGLAIPFLQGCLTTRTWAIANTESMTSPRVVAQVSAKLDGHAEASNGSLIVEYELNVGNRAVTEKYTKNLVLPFDAAGKLPYPFRYTGMARTPAAVAADLSSQQLSDLEHATANLKLASDSQIDHSPRVQRFTDQVDRHERVPRENSFLKVVVVAYTRSADGKWELLPKDAEWPKDAEILVFNDRAMRPLQDRKANQQQAGIMTPMTVLGDAVGVVLLAPLFIIGLPFILLRGGC